MAPLSHWSPPAAVQTRLEMTKTSSSAAGVSLRVCPRQTGTLQQEEMRGGGMCGGIVGGGGKKREKCLLGEEIKARHMQKRGPEV